MCDTLYQHGYSDSGPTLRVDLCGHASSDPRYATMMTLAAGIVTVPFRTGYSGLWLKLAAKVEPAHHAVRAALSTSATSPFGDVDRDSAVAQGLTNLPGAAEKRGANPIRSRLGSSFALPKVTGRTAGFRPQTPGR